jgi:hypothetical protein
VTTERKVAANRRNARLSTGPRSAAGKARVAQNALRHGLNVKVADDPLLTEEVARIARAIRDDAPRGGRGGVSFAELAYLARRVAEAQVDLMRVRRARHAILTRALDNPRYRSPRYLRRQIAMLAAVGELLTRGIAVPDDMRKAAFGRPRGPLKFALVVKDLAQQLARFERYERRALSRRKAAVAAFDAACTQGAPVLIELPAIDPPPAQEARRRRNKATAGAPGAPVVARLDQLGRIGESLRCVAEASHSASSPVERSGTGEGDRARSAWWRGLRALHQESTGENHQQRKPPSPRANGAVAHRERATA